MFVTKLLEAGYDPAMVGISLSHNSPLERMPRRAEILAPKEKGHNKFLEHIMVWLLVKTTRDVWQQMDTYRHASKQSESTMHTFMTKPVCAEDFDPEVDPRILAVLEEIRQEGNLRKTKKNLPEGFYQTREVILSYKTLRNMYQQRKEHRLSDWQAFFDQVLEQIEHPGFVVH